MVRDAGISVHWRLAEHEKAPPQSFATGLLSPEVLLSLRLVLLQEQHLLEVTEGI